MKMLVVKLKDIAIMKVNALIMCPFFVELDLRPCLFIVLCNYLPSYIDSSVCRFLQLQQLMKERT